MIDNDNNDLTLDELLDIMRSEGSPPEDLEDEFLPLDFDD